MSKEALKEVEEARQRSLESQRICAWCNDEFSTIEELIDHLYIEQGTRRYGYLDEALITSELITSD
jgi:hypothetical protein